MGGEETTAVEAVHVLAALEDAGCWVSLEGGWGVDALAGRQSRPHRDLDVTIDAAQEGTVLQVLRGLGYAIETDERPTRVELAAPGKGRVDVHPLRRDGQGNGVQHGPAGERWVYPATAFTTGTLHGRAVRCLSAEQQIDWHAGYELRPADLADLEILRGLVRRSSHSVTRSVDSGI